MLCVRKCVCDFFFDDNNEKWTAIFIAHIFDNSFGSNAIDILMMCIWFEQQRNNTLCVDCHTTYNLYIYICKTSRSRHV